MEEVPRTTWATRARRTASGESGTALLDIVLATVVLLVVLMPAMQLLVTTGKVVGNSRAEAIADGVATAQIAQDRAGWTSTSSAPAYSSSSACDSAYDSASTNTTFSLFLTACTTVSGMPVWTFQNGGWCAPNSSTSILGSTTSSTVAGAAPVYWVEVMVAWGGTAAPAPSTAVAAGKRLIVTSALLTPSGFSGSTSAPGCPL